MSPVDSETYVRAEVQRWSAIISKAGIKLQQ